MADPAAFQFAFGAALGRRGCRAGLEAQPGFAVYRNTTPDALVGALRSNYPVAAQILGGAAFDELALEYSRRRPPLHPVLLTYGGGFVDFLGEQPWLPELPYLADVARLERLWTESHVAADAEPLTLTDLSSIPTTAWSRLRLALHPATRYAALRTPGLTIWLAHRSDPPFDRLQPEWRAEAALFTRPAAEVVGMRIEPVAHALLHALSRGASVADAVASAAPDVPAADAASCFAQLVTSGAFAKPPQLERKA